MNDIANTEPINLHLIRHEQFRPAIRRRVDAYHAHFGDRLAAAYVSGSVHRDEAVPGVSDLDRLYFIWNRFSETDELWLRQVREQFERENPGLGGTTRPRSVEEALLRGRQPDADENARIGARAWGTRLRYDATRVWGRGFCSILSALRRRSITTRLDPLLEGVPGTNGAPSGLHEGCNERSGNHLRQARL